MAKQYLSYSEFKLYRRDKDRYIKQYILGEEFKPNREMILGSIIHKTIEDKKYDWIKALKDNDLDDKVKVVRKLLDKVEPKRPTMSEVSMMAVLKTGDKLFSIFDGFNKDNRELDEFKTSANKFIWNQRSVDNDEQLSFYAWVYHLTYHEFFKEIRLHWLDTELGNIKTFKTVRSMSDIKDIAFKVMLVINELKTSGLWEKRLSSRDRIQGKLLC